MGNWVIVIEGTGAHHNGKSYDADMLALDFVKKLKESQTVSHASFTHSARQDLDLVQKS